MDLSAPLAEIVSLNVDERIRLTGLLRIARDVSRELASRLSQRPSR